VDRGRAIYINGTNVRSAGAIGPDSSTKVEVGLRAHADTDRAFSAHFDNVVVAIDRE
jgi:hypothetical protein